MNCSCLRRLLTLKTVSMATVVLLVGSILGAGVPASAQTTLLSNLDASAAPSTGFGTTITSTARKSVAFTTGTTAYPLFSVQAWLSTFSDTIPGTSVMAFDLYTPSTPGGSDPGTLAVSLGTQNVNNLSSAPAVYTFTPSSAFVLATNTRYVLQMSWISGDAGNWYGNNPSVTPTPRNGSGYSNIIYRFDSNGSMTTTGNFNLFALNTTAVNGPEPGTLSLTLWVPLLGIMFSRGRIAAQRRKA